MEREGSWAGKRHGTGPGEKGDPTCQGQKPAAWRREQITQKARSTSPGWQKRWLELAPVSSRSRWPQGGTGRGGAEGLRSRLALGGGSQSRPRVTRLVKAIYIMYRLWLIRPLGRQRPRRARVPWPGGGGTRREGQGVQHLLGTRGGEGRKCRPWRLPIQKRGENSLNNGTKLRLSRGAPRASGRERPQRSLCRGLGALAAAFLSFTVLRELHHVVLLLLLLFG